MDIIHTLNVVFAAANFALYIREGSPFSLFVGGCCTFAAVYRI